MISKFHLEILKIIAKEENESVRMVLLAVFCKDAKFVKAIRSICRNTVKGKIGKENKDKLKIAKHIKEIRELAQRRHSTKPKIVQSGGSFLAVLVPLVASLLGPHLSNVFSKDDAGSV